MKDLERGKEVGKQQNKMEKLHISLMLQKELREMMDVILMLIFHAILKLDGSH